MIEPKRVIEAKKMLELRGVVERLGQLECQNRPPFHFPLDWHKIVTPAPGPTRLPNINLTQKLEKSSSMGTSFAQNLHILPRHPFRSIYLDADMHCTQDHMHALGMCRCFLDNRRGSVMRGSPSTRAQSPNTAPSTKTILPSERIATLNISRAFFPHSEAGVNGGPLQRPTNVRVFSYKHCIALAPAASVRPYCPDSS